MTSRILFFNLLKEDVKQRLWSTAIAFLLFFFSLPVVVALSLDEKLKNELTREYVIDRVEKCLSIQHGFMIMSMILLSVIMGVTSFSYLHSRQKVDFYHSIPVSRKNLFWANYFNGIFIVAVAYALNLLFTYGVIAVNGMLTKDLIWIGTKSFCFFVLHYCLLYTVPVIAMILTGNSFIGILGTFVFHIYGFILFSVLELCYYHFFDTIYDRGESIFTLILDKTSPVSFFVANIEGIEDGKSLEWIVVRLAVAFLATVILSFLSFWLYKKRESEAAGKAMAFKISMPMIQIPIVILSSLSGGLFFLFSDSTLVWVSFGLICGMLLSHCIIEIIYHFDFRKLFCHWKQMLVCGMLSSAVFLSFHYDIFGYDCYIPKKESIQYVGISFKNVNDWISYGDIEEPHNDTDNYQWEYISPDEYILNYMELKDTEAVLTLVKEAIDSMNQRNHFSQEEDTIECYRFSVKYTLNNGRNLYRTYELPGNKLDKEIVQIYENPEFRKAVYPILTQTIDNTAGVKVNKGDQTSLVSTDKNGTDKAITDQLLFAYQEELMNLKVDTMQRESPIASIQFITKKQEELTKLRMENNNNWQYNYILEKGYYPIYPSFQKTLTLLEECQVDVKAWNDSDYVKEITIDTSQFYGYDGFVDVPYLSITDAEEIRQIMKDGIMERYSSINPLTGYKNNMIRFSVVILLDGREIEEHYIISLENLPDSIENKLEKMRKA